MNSKLGVLVHLDTDLSSARIEVSGMVTSTNLPALYRVLRQTNDFLPGMDLAIDLGHAGIDDDARRDLDERVRDCGLPETVDPEHRPCNLRILER